MLAQASRAQQGPPRSGARPGLILRPTFIPAQNWAPPRRALDYTWGFTSPPALFYSQASRPMWPGTPHPVTGLGTATNPVIPLPPQSGERLLKSRGNGIQGADWGSVPTVLSTAFD